MSSRRWNETYQVTGIFAADSKESPMADANKVLVVSCSSDWWMDGGEGNIEHPPNKKWSFRGQNIVKATISDLINRRGLGSDKS